MAEPPSTRYHPIFTRLTQGPTTPAGALDAITERRVQQARADGLFDNLPGAGKPIPDIDRPRPPGWWATRLVEQERGRLRRIELDDRLRLAMPGLWRLPSEAQVRQRIEELNTLIDDHNRTSWSPPRARLDPDATVATWRRLRTR